MRAPLVYVALTSAVVSSLGMLLVPAIAQDMNVPVHIAQWMLTINLLAGAVATPIMGRLSTGPRVVRLLLISLTIILAGSIVAWLAPDFTWFLVGRALQGLSYGVVPVTIAVARRFCPPDRVAPTIATLSVTVATGLGLGYPLTGLLAGTFSYRAAFMFGVVFVASALCVAFVALPRNDAASPAPSPPFDYLGAVLMSVAVGAALFVLSEGGRLGWLSPAIVATATTAVAAGAVWVLHERRSEHPLVDLRVFRLADVAIAHAAAVAVGCVLYITMSMVSLAVQTPGLGAPVLPVTLAGLVIVPLSFGSLAANRIVRSAQRGRSLRFVLTAGAATMAIACVLLALARSEMWVTITGMLLVGLGMGAAFAAMPALINRQTSDAEFGSSVSINQLLRTVGGALGSAVSSAILVIHTTAGVISSAGPTSALLLCATVSLVLSAGLLILALRRQ